jgi:hypothetical protein
VIFNEVLEVSEGGVEVEVEVEVEDGVQTFANG